MTAMKRRGRPPTRGGSAEVALGETLKGNIAMAAEMTGATMSELIIRLLEHYDPDGAGAVAFAKAYLRLTESKLPTIE